MTDEQIIDLSEWEVTHREFVIWVSENNIDVYAVSYSVPTPKRIYLFDDLKDVLAFKLRFKRIPPVFTESTIGFTV